MLRYVEPLSDTRTPLGERRVSARRGWAGEKSDFFSILLMAALVWVNSLCYAGPGS
jgi:hypothetical protein